MKRMYKYPIILISVALCGLSLLAWGMHRVYFHASPLPKVSGVKKEKSPSISYDPAVLADFQRLYTKYDTMKRNCTMIGSMDIEDKADTSNDMKNVGFIFCKAGKNFYYQLGATETINADGLYIYIDHTGKTIILSSQKTVNYDSQPDFLPDLGASMKSEGYTMAVVVKDSIKTISLENEHQINCKQFSISYDTAGMQIRHLYARMTNLEYPMQKDKEKIVNINLSTWNDHTAPAKYFKVEAIVNKVNGTWKTTGAFTKYELTVLQ